MESSGTIKAAMGGNPISRDVNTFRKRKKKSSWSRRGESAQTLKKIIFSYIVGRESLK